MTLSQKQKRFANEYLIDFNKIRAARAARILHKKC